MAGPLGPSSKVTGEWSCRKILGGFFFQNQFAATGKIATVVGKPSKAFFEMALRDMDVRPDQAAMIGDDIITDIAGARKAGMRAILVKTGKYREEAVRGAPVQPTKIIDSIASIATIL